MIGARSSTSTPGNGTPSVPRAFGASTRLNRHTGPASVSPYPWRNSTPVASNQRSCTDTESGAPPQTQTRSALRSVDSRRAIAASSARKTAGTPTTTVIRARSIDFDRLHRIEARPS